MRPRCTENLHCWNICVVDDDDYVDDVDGADDDFHGADDDVDGADDGFHGADDDVGGAEDDDVDGADNDFHGADDDVDGADDDNVNGADDADGANDDVDGADGDDSMTLVILTSLAVWRISSTSWGPGPASREVRAMVVNTCNKSKIVRIWASNCTQG